MPVNAKSSLHCKAHEQLNCYKIKWVHFYFFLYNGLKLDIRMTWMYSFWFRILLNMCFKGHVHLFGACSMLHPYLGWSMLIFFFHLPLGQCMGIQSPATDVTIQTPVLPHLSFTHLEKLNVCRMEKLFLFRKYSFCYKFCFGTLV